MSILAVYCDAAEGVSRQHVGPMARTVDPACHSALYRIRLPIVIGNVLTEAPLVEWDFGAASVEAIMTDWHYAIGHRYAMFHRDVVKWLVPAQGW